jgi:hypothetical protein
MKKVLLPALKALALAVALLACQKTGTDPSATDLVAVEDANEATAAEDDIAALFDDAPGDFFLATPPDETHGLTNLRRTPDFCGATATLTNLPGGGLRTTVDFGAGQTCADGTTRKGKLTIDFVPGTGREFTRTITFENYAVNNRTLNGTTEVTMEGLADNRVRTAIKNLQITKDGRTITFTSNKTRTYDRKGTLAPNDDDITIEGSSSGMGSDGKGFSAVIGTPILIKNSCGRQNRVPVAGIVHVTPTGKSLRTVNYGNGTCDREYTVTIDGQMVTKEFGKR